MHFVIVVLSAHMLPHSVVATFCHMLAHFPMTVDSGELRHVCDDPVCPDQVGKLSKHAH